MGYRIKRRTAVIKFEGTDFDGAEVSCVFDVSLKTLFDFQSTAESEPENAFRRFGDEIITSWNLEDDAGNAIPADADGLLAQPPAFANALLAKWMEAMQAPPAPLGPAPNSGSTSAAQEPE